MRTVKNRSRINDYLRSYSFVGSLRSLFSDYESFQTKVDFLEIGEKKIPKYTNEFWTSKQRQASSLHEIAYRACFKPQLPRFFINLLTKTGDNVYDPFSGRGTTVIEAGILGRNIISNDINPLSQVLCSPRFFVPNLQQVLTRIKNINIDYNSRADIDISMFYHQKTEAEIVSLKKYFQNLAARNKSDHIDKWINMAATNKLTGHSPGFFSVYTLPPNQAASQKSQIRINEKKKQRPEYRNVKEIILKKTLSLTRNLNISEKNNLSNSGKKAVFLCEDSGNTHKIKSHSVQLTVTSPPFLDIVSYRQDNWLRCWFNDINAREISNKMSISKTVEDWSNSMGRVFGELFRITKKGGWVAFEVGEVRNGSINLDEFVIPLGVSSGFECEGVLINQQSFTKTSNIWGVKNNSRGTNTNRIVLFHK
ncbi:site-specific DNA-methyltransferase [Candidatus Giovannonibacteria bacterium]|nr:site-specific DNA-methyltransferase [Candidatus Giovannonibacteria bacterium]